MKTLTNKRIETIESSQTVQEAARKLKMTPSGLYFWLSANKLKIVRDTKLKVVSGGGAER